MKKRILFYYTHQESLGHTTRLLSIIQTLKKRYPTQTEIAVFQGGKTQDYLEIPKEVKWLNLPYPFYNRLDFKKRCNPNLLKMKARSNYMISKIKEFKPHIFITEFFPFGRRECYWELLPTLEYLKRRKIKIYGSIGYPCVTKSNIKMLLATLNFYDRILIHVVLNTEFNYFNKNTDAPILYPNFFKKFENRINYTGYILPFNMRKINHKRFIKRQFGSQDKIFVLVTRGAGAYYPKIITHSILAKNYLNSKYFFMIIPGPTSSEKEMSLFRRCLDKVKDKNIYMVKYLPNLPDLLGNSAITVSTAGYNTSLQLFYFRKKSIVIPFKGYPPRYGYIEQLSRAQMLKDYLGTSILDYDELSPQLLAKEIEKKYQDREPKSTGIDKNWFKGGEITSDLIMNS